jgi:hypothetical protein
MATAQRDDAWLLLTAGSDWAGRAFASVGITGTHDTPIRTSEAAFQRAQHLECQLLLLGQLRGSHDREAMLVNLVKCACYAGADLGPIPGGRLASCTSSGPSIVREVEPPAEALRNVGHHLGCAPCILCDLGLTNDVVNEAKGALSPPVCR